MGWELSAQGAQWQHSVYFIQNLHNSAKYLFVQICFWVNDYLCFLFCLAELSLLQAGQASGSGHLISYSLINKIYIPNRESKST